MTRSLVTIALVIAFASNGCAPSREEHREHPDSEEHAAHDGDHAETEPENHTKEGERGTGDVLRIRSEMLRDLRITTAAVESREGSEGVAMLGEVRVNEDAYAEVGSPISGRVTRLLVGLGDQVTAGQPLVELESVELGKARAEYVTAAAKADVAKQALERKRSLAAEGIAPTRELQEAEARAGD